MEPPRMRMSLMPKRIPLRIKVVNENGLSVNLDVPTKTCAAEVKSLSQKCFDGLVPNLFKRGTKNIFITKEQIYHELKQLEMKRRAEYEQKLKDQKIKHSRHIFKAENEIGYDWLPIRPNSPKYLISIRHNMILKEDHYIGDESVQDDDILLLLPRIISSVSILRSANGVKSIPYEAVLHATRDFPKLNSDPLIDKPVRLPCKMQREIYYLIVTLIDISEALLKNQKEVRIVVREMYSAANEVSLTSNKGETETIANLLESELARKFVQMGFNKDKVVQALVRSESNPLDALDWLMENDLTLDPCPNDDESSDNKKNRLPSFRYPRVPFIVNSHRLYQRATFQPNTASMERIVQMEANENKMLDALWIHNNNENAACEWLLKDRQVDDECLSAGVARNSELYEQLLKNPTIIASLTKPSMLFGLLHEIEEPVGSTKWSRDNADYLKMIQQVWNVHLTSKGRNVQI